MENNERDRKLERWLDEALSEYSAAEPRFGLEQRVLNRVRGEGAKAKRWGLWKWMPAFAAIAAVAIVGVAIRPMLSREPQVRTPQSGVAAGSNTDLANSKSVAQKTDGLTDKRAAVTRDRVDASVETSVATKEQPAHTDIHPSRTFKDVEVSTNQPASQTTVLQGPPTLAAAPPPPAISGTTVGGAGQANEIHLNGTAASAAPIAQKANEVSPEQKLATDAPDLVRQANAPEAQNAGHESIPMLPEPALRAADAKNRVTAPTGVIATEQVTVAKETAALKRMKKDKKERERAAQQQAGDAAFAEAFGTVVRTEIKQAPAGPRQFPSPSPLSEQEKLVLAAARKMKDIPKPEAQGGNIPPVEIKDVQIAPLEAPKK